MNTESLEAENQRLRNEIDRLKAGSGDMFGDSLERAIEQMIIEADTVDGGICPCCTQIVKTYVRKFSSTMALTVIWLYKMEEAGKLPPGAYIHIGKNAPRRIVRTGGTPSQCGWWGLIEAQRNEDDPTKKNIGFWRLTDRGRDFAKGLTTIESHCQHGPLVPGGVVLLDDAYVTIVEALGEHFDYSEMMGEEIRLKAPYSPPGA